MDAWIICKLFTGFDQGSINLSSVWHQQSRALHLTISHLRHEGPPTPPPPLRHSLTSPRNLFLPLSFTLPSKSAARPRTPGPTDGGASASLCRQSTEVAPLHSKLTPCSAECIWATRLLPCLRSSLPQQPSALHRRQRRGKKKEKKSSSLCPRLHGFVKNVFFHLPSAPFC